MRALSKLKKVAHVIAGALTALSSVLSPVLSIIAFLTFIIYEIDEDWHIKDGAYRDILAFGIGFFTCVAIMILLAVTKTWSLGTR